MMKIVLSYLRISFVQISLVLIVTSNMVLANEKVSKGDTQDEPSFEYRIHSALTQASGAIQKIGKQTVRELKPEAESFDEFERGYRKRMNKAETEVKKKVGIR